MVESAMNALNQAGAGAPPVAKPPEINPDEEVMYMVRDLNAKSGERVHELMDPRTKRVSPYRFQNQWDGVQVPMAIALGLVGNPGFDVKDAKGRTLQPSRTDGNDNNSGVILRAHEVIATMDELTHEALIARANVITAKMGEGKFTKAVKKEEVISFLLVNNGSSEEEAGVAAGVPDDGVELEMDED